MEPRLLYTNVLPASGFTRFQRDRDLVVGITIGCGVVVTNIVGIDRWILLDQDVVIRLKVREGVNTSSSLRRPFDHCSSKTMSDKCLSWSSETGLETDLLLPSTTWLPAFNSPGWSVTLSVVKLSTFVSSSTASPLLMLSVSSVSPVSLTSSG
jgi:hypothetical protein